MKKAIDQDTLQALIESGSAREFLARRTADGKAWTFCVRLGITWLPVRSRREPLRRWASLTAVERFAAGLGVRSFLVEL
ncbi:hypothetical protein [Azotobacter beijerinckii]|uniref:Uncharacterized protein n=1 Tax=Azotobacter beijerinckii TaxID=170623 RepID=A0A1I4IIM3_9GAMM|nr:hypothetical protein [Azotobacter beijerinckii]SFL53661.1 hypothetical protein SAMN04244574_04599 [Azotobacter beijerinckii]